MLVYEYKLSGNTKQYAAIDEAIRTVQFIRNKSLRGWTIQAPPKTTCRPTVKFLPNNTPLVASIPWPVKLPLMMWQVRWAKEEPPLFSKAGSVSQTS